ncbi:hypothetical protein AVEN_99680-1 [Araneus ventricosus]|uniref:CCHC-type domain-containing protein n=1 Tax=Araneus ventricosus TaxID=182803 RepID=A0A4Y2DNP0_ARAVE|nr:hypothetical protein AVEN_99680-1 [Araneus ventricosus]
MDFRIVDINNELSSQNIAAAKIVRFKKKGTSDPIPTVLVDEIGKTNRIEIKIGRLIFKVSKFIENPKLCYKCLKCGHTQLRCNNIKRCKNCGGSHDVNSTLHIKYFRCEEAHDALSKECRFFSLEKDIINLEREKDLIPGSAEESHFAYFCTNCKG